MDSEGSATELRSRMSHFANEHPEYIFGKTNIKECTMNQLPEGEESAPDHSTVRTDIAEVINQIRKWRCYFDGKDLLSGEDRGTPPGEGFSGD